MSLHDRPPRDARPVSAFGGTGATTTTEPDSPAETPTVDRDAMWWPGGPSSRPDRGVRGDMWALDPAEWTPGPPVALLAPSYPPDHVLPTGPCVIATRPDHHGDQGGGQVAFTRRPFRRDLRRVYVQRPRYPREVSP